MTPHLISRRTFVARRRRGAVVAACGGGDDDRPAAHRRPAAARLALRGVNYDTDRELWRAEFVPPRDRGDPRRPPRQRASSCSDPISTGSPRAPRSPPSNGLHVWFEPRQFDAERRRHARRSSPPWPRAAEELARGAPRRRSVAGRRADDLHGRSAAWGRLARTRRRPRSTRPAAEYNGRLNDVPGRCGRRRSDRSSVASSRTRPGRGRTSTGAGFDVVGIDLYRDAENAATFVERCAAPAPARQAGRDHRVRLLLVPRAPRTSAEAASWWSTGGPTHRWSATASCATNRSRPATSTSCSTSSRPSGVHGAFVYNFIEPGNPYSPDPRYDFDMAGFGVVKCYPTGTELAYDAPDTSSPRPPSRRSPALRMIPTVVESIQ